MDSAQGLAPPTGTAHRLTVVREMAVMPRQIYRAWTEGIDSWFAEPGHAIMRARKGEPFVFQTLHEGKHHTHHGRILELVPDRLVELTWATGRGGTEGAETIVRVEIEPRTDGSLLRLTHSGFHDEAGCRQHEQAWSEHVLPHLEEVLRGGKGAARGAGRGADASLSE